MPPRRVRAERESDIESVGADPLRSAIDTGVHTGTCTARAALAGNPSDGYGGAVLAVPVPDVAATVTATPAADRTIAATDPDLRALLQATVDAFDDAVAVAPPVELTASTTIPRSVGLAGSSALVIAALRALAASSGHRWDPIELAELALSVEVDRLGITAGLQDRLVQAVGRPILMRFDPVSFHPVDGAAAIPLFVAWDAAAAEPSGAVHRPLRERFDAGDHTVHRAMRELAGCAERGARAITDGDRSELAVAIDRSFDLRTSIVDVGATQERLVDVGRHLGAAVNSAGSGGSVVGMAPDPANIADLRRAYTELGAGFVALGR
jgi:glucuronokinase